MILTAALTLGLNWEDCYLIKNFKVLKDFPKYKQTKVVVASHLETFERETAES